MTTMDPIGWARKQLEKSTNCIEFDPTNHTYHLKGFSDLPSVSSIVAHVSNYGDLPDRVLVEAARQGTEAHRAVLNYEMLGDLDEDNNPHVDAWRKFREGNPHLWHIGSEVMLYHSCLLYAGTLDMVAYDDKESSYRVIDLKTGASRRDKSWQVQTSLYSMLLDDVLNRDLKGSAKVRVGNPIIVWTGGGKTVFVPRADSIAASAWGINRYVKEATSWNWKEL
jgi:hypothetical protein